MEEQEKERAQLAAINEIIRTIGFSLELHQVYETFATQLKKLVAFDRASITLIEGDKIRFFALSSAVESELGEGTIVSLEGTAAQWVAAHKKAHIARDYAEARQFFTEDIHFREGMRSAIRTPLFSRGKVIGSLNLSSRQPNAYGEEEREVLEQITGPLAVAIENFQLFEQAKKAAEELQRSEEHFRALIENSSDVITVISGDGTILYGSPSYEQVLGYKPEELVGKNVFEFFHPDDAPDAAQGFTGAIQSGSTPRSYEHRFRHKDGSWRVLEALGRSIVDDSVVAGIVINARDITERKRAEQALRRSEELFRAVIEHASDIITVISDDGTVLYGSPSYERLLGYKPEELVGKNVFEYFHPDDAAGAVKGFAAVTQRSRPTTSREHRFRHKDGSWRVLEALGRSIVVDDLGVTSVVINSRDITERKQAEEAFLRHAKQLEALHAVAATVSQTLDLEQMLNNVLQKVLEVVEVDAGYITFFDVETRTGYVRAHRGISEQFVEQIGKAGTEKDVRRWREHREPAFGLHRMYSGSKQGKVLAAAEREGLQSSVAVPLWSKDTLHGALVLVSRTPRRFSADDLELLQAIASEIAVGIENARLFEEMRNAAITDGLTGLYNHRHFHERLEEEVARTLRFGGECSLIMLDLDYFKIYNDLLGHVDGDEALRRVGQLLRDYTRQVDITCRYGGEEFAVILPQTGPPYAYQAAERLRQAVEAVFALERGATGTNLTVSLGVASCPSDALSRQDLIQLADIAMREAKERGRNQTRLASDLPSAGRGKGETGWEVAQNLKAVGPNKIYALAAGVDARDHYTYGHSRNVSKYAVATGQALGLSAAEIKRLRIAGLLHDIGKIGISDSIIRKSGPLDEEEWEMMRKHSELGATIVSHMPELGDCAPAIRHHHERYDGSGYPSGLKGEDIPLEARIIAIADAYDTITTPRSYRQTVSPEKALEELKSSADTQFDPLLVETFAQMVNTGRILS